MKMYSSRHSTDSLNDSSSSGVQRRRGKRKARLYRFDDEIDVPPLQSRRLSGATSTSTGADPSKVVDPPNLARFGDSQEGYQEEIPMDPLALARDGYVDHLSVRKYVLKNDFSVINHLI
ncbi:hypothetical protein Ddye_023062 [Dipteronia dyeriana]|uniref:Uncharacterized protein n=1 Tax=Dipteronia dyeriana TaxID=168575 RepID=A0AAD9TT57_9ROSI|nr:hypothetical protein Ddye_023062 [Dipteronia dyeriana]